MTKEVILALTIAAGAVMPLGAHDKPQPAQPSAPPATAAPSSSSGARHIPLKVQLTLTRFEGDKKLSSVPYMLGVLTNAQKTNLRMGVQVPVVQTVFGAKSEGGTGSVPQSSYTYRSVGTDIDCQAQDLGNGLFNLVITVDDSTIYLDRSREAEQANKTLRDVPAFRSFRASFAMVLRDGQTMQYASATDPVSGEVMKIDVTLSLAK